MANHPLGLGAHIGHDETDSRKEFATMPDQINIVLNWFEELKRLVPTE